MKPPPKFIRVFLAAQSAQDEKIVSQMLQECGQGLFIVCGVFGTLEEAVYGLETGVGVDVILLDLNLSDSKGMATFCSLAQAAPEHPVIILADNEDEPIAVEALRLGAQDYLLKCEMTGRMLVRSIHCAIERKQVELEGKTTREELEKKVGELSHALAQVSERLSESLDQLNHAQTLAQQDRLHALERITGGIAHDFNNALSPILAYSEWLLRKTGALDDETGLRQALHNIHSSAEHCATVVLQLRKFARAREESDPLEPLDLCEVIQSVVELTQPSWKDQAQARGCAISMETHYCGVPKVQGAREELVELFANLILNAVDAIQEKGVISVSVESREGRVLVTMIDNGEGAGEQSLEPLFNTSADRQIGRDLGFGAIYAIAQRHDAVLSMGSTEGGGTKVTVDFPAAPVPQEPPSPEKQETVSAPNESMKKLRILAVDDEPGIRQVLRIYLTEEGHSVVFAESGAEALSIFEKGRFDLLLTDYAMPGMSGDRLAAAIRTSDPDIRIALLTGFGSQMPQGAPLRLEVDSIIAKPFTTKTLQAGIAEAMQGGK